MEADLLYTLAVNTCLANNSIHELYLKLTTLLFIVYLTTHAPTTTRVAMRVSIAKVAPTVIPIIIQTISCSEKDYILP